MPLSQFMQKQVLDFLCGGATATRPPGRWLQFANTNPRTDSAFDGPIPSRVSVSFNFAISGASGFVSNALATTGFTTGATAICTLTGWNLYDSSVGGNRIAYGTLATTFSLASGTVDQVAVSAAALRITLS